MRTKFKEVGEIKIATNGDMATLSINIGIKGGKRKVLQFDIWDWDINRIAEELRKYHREREQRFAINAKQFREAMGYTHTEAVINYMKP